MRISKYSIGVPCGPLPMVAMRWPARHRIAFTHRNGLGVSVRAQIRFAVLNDDELAITEQTRACVDDPARRRPNECPGPAAPSMVRP